MQPPGMEDERGDDVYPKVILRGEQIREHPPAAAEVEHPVPGPDRQLGADQIAEGPHPDGGPVHEAEEGRISLLQPFQ